MNVHKHARMTVHGRLLLVRRVRQDGWRVVDAAAAAGVSERAAYSWLARYRAGGERALHDRSSAPARSPHQLPAATVALIERLRRQRWTGPRIARANRPAGVDRRHRPAPARTRSPGGPGRQAADPALRAPRCRRAAAHRQQETRPDRRPRAPDHRRPPPAGARARLGISARGDRRRLAPGLHGAAARRARTELRRLPRPRRCLVRQPRRPDQAGHDRQCLRLHPRARLPGRPLPSSEPATSPPSLTDRAPMARPSASSRPPCANGSTPALTPASQARATDMPAWLHWYNHHRPHAGIHADTPAAD